MKSKAVVYQWLLIPSTDDAVKTALYVHGVLSVSLNAVDEIVYYAGGIVNTEKCRDMTLDQLDHAVAMVGYDDSTSPPHWVMRNSWSTAWGEFGHFRVAQGRNDCGLTLDVAVPKVVVSKSDYEANEAFILENKQVVGNENERLPQRERADDKSKSGGSSGPRSFDRSMVLSEVKSDQIVYG